MTGNTLPRLQTRDIEKILIPLPDPDHQTSICQEAKNREEKAKHLREEANAELERAKAKTETILLGEVA
jgi:restriction endonuclease S subunit